MRNLKRVLTLVMAVAMMMSLLVVGASAKFTDQDKIENVDAVNMNVALGIIKGRDTGDFDPTGNVTRAEMAKMIAVALNGGKEPTLGTLINPSFKDIKGHWAEGFVEYCTSLGIVAGMGDGTFAPNANVTATQAAKMLLVAMGYDAVQENFNGNNWSVNINVRASQKGLYSNVVVDPNAPLNRDNAAQMVANALEADMVEYEYKLTTVNGQLTTQAILKAKTGETMLTQKFDLRTGYGILDTVTYNKSTKNYIHEFSALMNGIVTPDGGVDLSTAANLAADADYSNLSGYQVKALYKTANGKTTVYGMYPYKTQVIASGVADDAGTSTRSGQIKFDGSFYKAEKANGTATNNNAEVVAKEFNVSGAPTYANLAAIPAHFAVKLLDVDGDGAIDTAVYMPYTVGKVTFVGTTNVTVGGKSYNLDSTDVYSGIKRNDFAKIIEADNSSSGNVVIAAVDKMVNGKVTSINSGVYTIDGLKYSIADVSGKPTLKVNDVVKNAATVNGFIFDADTTGTVVIEDYAVVTDAGNVVLQGDQAKLLLADGTKKTVSTAYDYSGPYVAGAFAADTDTPLVGALVTFTTDNDGDYVLTAAKTSNADAKAAGFDVISTGNFDVSSGKVKYIAGMDIADDAVIFVDKNTGYEVITGAKLKSMGITSPVLTMTVAYAHDNSSTGGSTVKMAYIHSMGALSSVSYQYAYATKAAGTTTNSAGRAVTELTLWDGNNTITLKAKTSTGIASNVKKGDVVAYTLDKDGLLDKVDRYSTANATPAAEVVAITYYNGKYIGINSSTTRNELTSDTKYLYVNPETNTGAVSEGITLAEKDVNGNFMRNAVVLLDTNGDVLLVVQALSDKMVDASNTDYTVTGANFHNGLFNTYNNVTVSDAGTLAYVVVPAGKTLTLNDDTTITTLSSNAGSIKVAATKTLTITNATTAANVEKIVGVAAGAKLTLAADTTTAPAATVVGATLKFWTTAGTSATTNGTVTDAVIDSADSNKIQANTYVFGTAYIQTTTVADTAVNNVWVKQ